MMHDFWKATVNSKKKSFSQILFYCLLRVVSFFYFIASFFPEIAVFLRLRSKKSHTRKIILVGNITVGGTGKTPFTEELARRLVKAGKNVLVVEKGYKRKKKKNIETVSDGTSVYLNSAEAGDEPFIIARNIPEAKVIVSDDKTRGLEYGLRKFLPDAAIIDDGFQKRHYFKNASTIVLVDALNPFGLNKIFPAGYLREPVKVLKESENIVITNSNLISQDALAALEKKIASIAPEAKIFTAEHEPKYFYSFKNNEKYDLQKFAGRRVILLSGLGNPEGFEKTMGLLSVKMCASLRKPDHHKFKKREIKAVISLLEKTGAEAVITTEKDEVKINRRHIGDAPFFALKIGMNVKNIKELEKRLKVA